VECPPSLFLSNFRLWAPGGLVVPKLEIIETVLRKEILKGLQLLILATAILRHLGKKTCSEKGVFTSPNWELTIVNGDLVGIQC
jgi:hypothetical protein